MSDARKLLLAIQFWAGDQKQAMQVARLCADLEIRHSDQADFLFVSRFDCAQDADSVKYVSKKFNVHTHTSRRRATGWPFGCNELWFETIQWVFEHTVQDLRAPRYKAVLTFEADAFPLCPNWVSMLSSEWDDLRPANVVGALQKYPGLHINGNAMFSCDHDFTFWLARKVSGCAPSGGWDYILRDKFRKWGWADSGLFRSWWQTPTLKREGFQDLLRQGVAFLHGVKDDSVIRHVREHYGLTTS